MIPAYPQSYYAARAEARTRAPFSGTAKADVVVVGGGYTGLSAALHLAEAGAHVMLLEAARIGFAASGRNGGQIHSGFRIAQAALETWLGEEHARALWWLAEDAKALVRARIARHAIDCALRDGVLIAAHSPAAARRLAAQTRYLNERYDYAAARMLSREETNARIGTTVYHGALHDAGGGHLHPLAFAIDLAQAAEQAGAKIYEGSRVLALEARQGGATVRLDLGMIAAGHVVLAGDASVPELAPSLAPYLAAVENYAVATAPLDEALRRVLLSGGEAVADTRHIPDYYRLSADGRLLFAASETYGYAASDIAKLVRPHMLNVFPLLSKATITHAWRGTVSFTRTRMPHFGRLGENILFGYGYSGQGVALAVLGGKLLAEAATGKSEGFELLASIPAKPFPGGALWRKPLVGAALAWLRLLDTL